MAGPFDDLVPAQKAKGAFDDLIPERSTGEKAARLGGQFAQNANDVIAGTLGAPVDLLTAGLQKIGAYPSGAPTIKGTLSEQITGSPPSPPPAPIGGSESIKKGIDYVATLPSRLGDALSQGSTTPLTESRTSRFEPENRAEKIAAGVGSGFGALASTLLPAGVIARAAAPGGVTQGVAQALASQPAMQGASALAGGAATGATDNPYVGLAASLAVPVGASAARGVVSPITNRLNPNEIRLAQLAQNEGIDLTPGQATGSRFLRGLEETMAKLPLSAGPMQDTYAGQRGQFNQAVLARTGSNATEASPGTLGQIRQDIGQRLDSLAQRTTVNPDQQFVGDIRTVAQDYGRRLPTDLRPVFQSYMDDLEPVAQAIQNGQRPQITGEVYARMRSGIGQTIRANNAHPELQNALRGIQTALDDAVERSTTGQIRQEWQDTRRQYQALTTVDKSMSGGTQADRSQANIPMGAFSQAVRGSDPAGYARARGQYGDLAKVADFLAPKIPDSGTASRGAMISLLTGGALGGPIAGAGGFTGPALAAGAAAAATPYAVSRLYNTDLARRYLTNQLAGQTNFGPLLGMEGGRQASLSEDRRMKELARILMRANEQGAR